MRRSPSIVPHVFADQDVYLVLEGFGDWLGHAWCETAEEDGNRATLSRHLIEGEYMHPARIVAFNTTQGSSERIVLRTHGLQLRSATRLGRTPTNCEVQSFGVSH
jgi:hypothetical protein